MNADKELDCIGLFCPEPLFRTRQALNELENDQILRVLADDPAAKEDISRLVKRLDFKMVKIEEKDEIYEFYIQKKEGS